VTRKVIRQGTFDGFCGLYACALGADAISKGSANLVFYEMLSALEKRKRLTAKRIASLDRDEIGFECEDLVKAFNDTGCMGRLKLASVSFANARFINSKFVENAQLGFDQSCAFVIKVNGGNHWVAAVKQNRDKSIKCVDSSPVNNRESVRRIRWDEGLMIGPSDLIKHL
jgi:hypothetical protein